MARVPFLHSSFRVVSDWPWSLLLPARHLTVMSSDNARVPHNPIGSDPTQSDSIPSKEQDTVFTCLKHSS